MKQLPKIVRERLQSTTPVAGHPEADVLNAFAEQSLSSREQSTVFEHLSRCDDCREIVLLALPADEAMQVTGEASKPSANSRGLGWRLWPALRLGGAVAAVAILSTVIVLHERGRQVSTTAANLPVTKPTMTVASATTSAGSKPTPPAVASDAVTLAGHPRTAENQILAKDAGATIGALPPGNKTAGAARARIVGSHDRAQNQTVQTTNETPATPQIFDNASQDNPQQDDSIPNHSGEDAARLSKAKPAVPMASESSPAAGLTPPAVPLQTRPDLLMHFHAPVALWSVNSSGILRRSFDQGATWREVNVVGANISGQQLDARVGPTDVLGKTVANEDAPHKMDKRLNIEKIAPAAETGSPTFRVVASSSPEVWAGGLSGLLYHSTDEGAHWTRVSPSPPGLVLTGDITSIEIPQAGHCKIQTSTPEIWITSDHGQSWQRQ